MKSLKKQMKCLNQAFKMNVKSSKTQSKRSRIRSVT